MLDGPLRHRVLTQFGRLLREPVGPDPLGGHRDGLDLHGAIDGAVRSGERVAREVLDLL